MISYAIRNDSTITLFKGIAAVTMFSVLVTLPWVVVSVVVVFGLYWICLVIHIPETLTEILVWAVMLAAMGIGARIGWRYLSNGMPENSRDWQL
jgi:hypothetical protein